MSSQPKARERKTGDGADPSAFEGAATPLSRMIDVLAFSPLIPAAIACTVSLVASRILGAPGATRWAAIAFTGSFVVYGLDRLRDVDRDRETSPLRTRFMLRSARLQAASLSLTAIPLAVLVGTSPHPVILLCVTIGALGLLHRRLKHIAAAKTLYVSLAWTLVTVGLPWLDRTRDGGGWLASLLFMAFAANLIASNLRDDEAHLLRGRPGSVLVLARTTAAAGIATALVAPSGVTPAAWIPAAELLALLFYRPTEHYGHLAIDGALLAGALTALLALNAR